MEVQNGVIGNYADWLLYPAQVCGILMPAMPERANVADAVWTANNFQATYAEEDSEIAPFHHRSTCNGGTRNASSSETLKCRKAWNPACGISRSLSNAVILRRP